MIVQEAKLNVAQTDLDAAQATLDEKQAELDEVQAMYDAAMKEKQVNLRFLFQTLIFSWVSGLNSWLPLIYKEV